MKVVTDAASLRVEITLDNITATATNIQSRSSMAQTSVSFLTPAFAGGGTAANRATSMADLNETSLEDALIDISTFTDDKGLTISVQASKLVVPPQLVFVADRILNSTLRSGTADNDINAVRNTGVLPGGYTVNHYLADPDAFFLLTSVTDSGEGLKMFQRTGMETTMEPDFTTGNIRYKARERYSFGFSDWRGIYGSQGA